MALLYTLMVGDGGGDFAPVRFWVDETVANTPAIQNTIAFRLWDYLSVVTTGTLDTIHIDRRVDISAYNLAGRPLVTSDIEEKVIVAVLYQGVGKQHKGQITIPCAIEGQFTNSGAGKIWRVGETYVDMYLNIIKQTYASGGMSIVSAHNEPLVQSLGGRQAFG